MIKNITSLGLFGIFRLIFDLIITKFFFPGCRIVRLPFYIRRVGSLVLGPGFSSGPGLIIDVLNESASVVIGHNVYANYRLHIGANFSVEIGDDCLFGSDCLIIDHNHGSYTHDCQSHPMEAPVRRALTGGPIKIGDKCWFGDRVSVLPGVTVGTGVVVGVGSVIVNDLPDYVIAIGVPARVVKKFDFSSGAWVKVN